jgi:hypothetical protein
MGEPGRWVLAHEGSLPLNQNGSDSPWRKRTDRKNWRTHALALAQLAGLPRERLVRVRISGTVYRRNLGVADAPGDLERFKSVVDGLVASSYLPDDTRRFVEYTQPAEEHADPAHPKGFRLLIEELPHDADTERRAVGKYRARRSDATLAAARASAARRARGAGSARSGRPLARAYPKRQRRDDGTGPAAAAEPPVARERPRRARVDDAAGGDVPLSV